MTQIQETPPDSEQDQTVTTTELVAKTVASISQIGNAQRALLQAGYAATVTGNRITVDGVIEAHLIMSNGNGWWQVYNSDGTPPMWTVGAFDNTMSDWSGAE